MELFGYPREIFMGYHRDILGDLYWMSNGISQGEAQEIFFRISLGIIRISWEILVGYRMGYLLEKLRRSF